MISPIKNYPLNRVNIMPKSDLKAYMKWFVEVIPERTAVLALAVSSTEGFEAWEPNQRATSLDTLGQWLSHSITTRPRTSEEIAAIKAGSTFDFGPLGDDLTDETFSLAIDVGMYLANVFLRETHGRLEWDQNLTSKKSIDYGQPVLVGVEENSYKLDFNPVSMVVGICYRLTRGRFDGARLREVYDIWLRKIPDFRPRNRHKGTKPDFAAIS